MKLQARAIICTVESCATCFNTHRVPWDYSDDHLGLDRRGAISILLDEIILALLELVHLANVVVDVQNLVPDRVLRRVDVLDANRPTALVALAALAGDLLHHCLVLG